MAVSAPLRALHAAAAGALSGADLDLPALSALPPVALIASGGVAFGPVDASWIGAMRGRRAHGFGEVTWFERIHVEPYYHDFGFLISTQVLVVRVWNASRTSERIASGYVVSGDEGASLDDPPSFPLRFMSMRQRSFDFTVTEDGPPQFTNRLVFEFPGIDDAEVDLNVEGIRVVPFPIDPSGDIVEGYGYLTRILTSIAEHEQRAALRAVPRRSWSFDFVLVGRDHRLAQALLHGWSAQPFGLPVWYDETTLDAGVSAGGTTLTLDTTLRDWDELAILWASPVVWEAVLIESITDTSITLAAELLADWPASTKVYPLRLARIEARQLIEHRGLETSVMRATFKGEDYLRE